MLAGHLAIGSLCVAGDNSLLVQKCQKSAKCQDTKMSTEEFIDKVKKVM